MQTERQNGLGVVLVRLIQLTERPEKPNKLDSAPSDESTAASFPLATRAVPEDSHIKLNDLPKKEEDAGSGRGNQ